MARVWACVLRLLRRSAAGQHDRQQRAHMLSQHVLQRPRSPPPPPITFGLDSVEALGLPGGAHHQQRRKERTLAVHGGAHKQRAAADRVQGHEIVGARLELVGVLGLAVDWACRADSEAARAGTGSERRLRALEALGAGNGRRGRHRRGSRGPVMSCARPRPPPPSPGTKFLPIAGS